MSVGINASVVADEEIADEAGYQKKFHTIWVGTAGNIAISRDGGSTFNVYKSVPGGADFVREGDYIGTLAQGTTATDLIAGTLGL